MNEKCKWVLDNIAPFLDEELPKEDASTVKEHLSACEGCTQEADAFKESWKLFEDALPNKSLPRKLYANPFKITKPAENGWFKPLAVGLSFAAAVLILRLFPVGEPVLERRGAQKILPVISEARLIAPPPTIIPMDRATGSGLSAAPNLGSGKAMLNSQPILNDSDTGLNVAPYLG